MELTHRAHKVSRFAPDDVISSMPDNVITNIMDRLPLQEAVRTSILSRNWRFKWTMLSQLVTDENFFKYLSVTKGEKELGRIITSLLLQLSGSITKFALSMGNQSCSLLDHDINLWILFLSKKRLQDLYLLNLNVTLLKLPTHLFSCLELKHLKLRGCHFDPPVTFHGFPNLLSLELHKVKSESRFGQFISLCPALDILRMGMMYSLRFEEGILKLVDIAKLANLKILSFPLRVLGDMKITSSNRLFELVGTFPKLEELHLAFGNCKLTEGDDAEKTPPTTFPCLKALRLFDVDLKNGIMLSCVIGMIRRSLNLHTLEIKAIQPDVIRAQQPTLAICSRVANYNTRGLLQLQNASFINASENENDVRLLEYVLACSPFLRQIVIHPCPHLSSDEKFKLAKKLLALQRASTIAKVYI